MKTIWHGENRVRHIEKLKGSFLSLKAKKSNTIKNEIFHKYYLCWPSIFRTFPQVLFSSVSGLLVKSCGATENSQPQP